MPTIILNTNEATGGKSRTKVEDLEVVGFTVERQTMENGDFVLPDIKVVVESKTWSDGIGSMISGRLDEQVARLVEECQKTGFLPILCVEEGYVDKHAYRFLEPFKDHLNTLSPTITIIRTKNQKHTAKTLWRMAEKGDKFQQIQKKCIVLDSTTPELTVLCAIPTIGEELAKRILKRYGTVKNAIAWSHDWGSVEGIADGKLKKISACMDKVYK